MDNMANYYMAEDLVSPSLQISLVVLPGCRVASVWVLFVWGVFVFVWLCGCCFCLVFRYQGDFQSSLYNFQ